MSYLFIHKDHQLQVHGINAGAEMATLFLARFLAKRGHRVVVAAQLADGPETDQGVEFWDLGADYDFGAAIQRANSELESYHLISAGRSQPFFEVKNTPQCLSRSLISHDRSGNDTGIEPKVLCRILDQVICVSNAQREVFLDAGADPEKVVVIHNGVDHDLFQPGDLEQRDFRKLVFVGALVQDKGVPLLINSYCQLKSKYQDLSLDVYGSADLWGRNEIYDPTSIEGQVPDIKFHGKVPQEEVVKAFQGAGICVVPSIWFDPFPLTSIEAQVTGCPVVTFDVGGLGEGVVQGETGIVIPEVDNDALTRTLDELLSDPARLRTMSKCALEKARPYYTWERVASTVEELCGKIAAKRSSAALPAAALSQPEKTSSSNVEKGPLGLVTTWKQECGLATYANFLFGEFDKNSLVILAEDASDARRHEDESSVVRCWKRDSGDYSALEVAIEEQGIKLLHLNAQSARFFHQPDFSHALKRLRDKGVKIVLQLHSVFTIDPSLQILVQQVDMTLVHSPECRLEVIANGASPQKVRVVPHGVVQRELLSEAERASFRSQIGVAENEHMVVSFGFIQPHKGIDGLIQAVAELEKNHIPCQAFVVGRANERDPNATQYLSELKQLAQASGVERRIHFLDRFVSEDEVANYLAAADAVFMNYQSQHFEASGACSLAVGAGAVVAASIAPPFMAFGDSVWHITSGFPATLSLAALLQNKELQEELRANAARYAHDNSWPAIAQQLMQIYCDLSFEPSQLKKEIAVNTERIGGVSSRAGDTIKVLMQNRPNTFTQRGGDTVVLEKTIAGLRKHGVDVTVDLEAKEDPAAYDLVHLFNFALPNYIRPLAERAKAAGTPYVVTTLCEDVPAFHNQSIQMAQALVRYVGSGQSDEWWSTNIPQIGNIAGCDKFDNAWVAENAAALFPNGAAEAHVLQQNYGALTNLEVVQLGYEIGTEGDPVIFEREHDIRDFVLCVGRFESRKNQLMLLKALEHSDIPVVLAGGGFSYQPEYDQAVRMFQRAGKTIILERVSDEMLASAYAAAKVHALPSWYELPGLVSLEAAYHNCNVVVCKSGTSPDYLGEKAFYCSAEDEQSIRNAVLAAYYSPQQPGLREQIMQFTWEGTATRTRQVYQQVLQGAPQTVSQVALAVPEQLHQAEEAAREKEFDEAHRLFAEIEEQSPTCVRAIRGRAAVFMAQEDVAQARIHFERARTLDATDPKTLSGLGLCDMMEGNPAQAYPRFLRALELDPDQPVAILQLLECSYIMNQYDDLERVLKSYVERHPDEVDMQYCYAGCLYKLGRGVECRTLLRQVLAKNPRHIGANELMQRMSEEPEKTPQQSAASTSSSEPAEPKGSSLQPEMVRQAIDDLVQARADSPNAAIPAAPVERHFDSTDARISELEELKRKRDLDEVLTGCDQILQSPAIQGQQRERAALLRAEVKALQGDIAEAHSVFEEIHKQHPKNSRALCGLGAIAASTGDWKQAENCFRQAHAIDPEFDVALAGIGMCYAQGEQYNQAWEQYQQALRKNPENTRALLGTIELGYHLNRLDEIEQALQAYLDMHPADLDFLYSLAGCYFAQNRLNEALSEVNKIVLFQPEHKNALELKQMISDKIGFQETAR